MAMAVQADGVTGGHDLRRGRRVAQHLLAYEEERSPCPALGKDLEHGRRALRVWAVVESDCRSRGLWRFRSRLRAPRASVRE